MSLLRRYMPGGFRATTLAAPTISLGTATATTQPVSISGGSGATAWALQYAIASSNSWSTFSTPTPGTTSVTITGLTASTSYDYRITATSATDLTRSNTSTGSTASSGTWAWTRTLTVSNQSALYDESYDSGGDALGAITAFNGAKYYGNVLAFQSWKLSDTGNFYTYGINNEHDWGADIFVTDRFDGPMCYASVVRGWKSGTSVNTTRGVMPSDTLTTGIRVNGALTKAHARWAFTAPASYFGTGTYDQQAVRTNCLWDTYFHTSATPGKSETAHTSLMINQYWVDRDQAYGSAANGGTAATIDGFACTYVVESRSWATGNTIEYFIKPFTDYTGGGTSGTPRIGGVMDLAINFKAFIDHAISIGALPDTDYLTSIQVGWEVQAAHPAVDPSAGTYRTTAYWTALQSETDGA